jgi:hypothetical protein
MVPARRVVAVPLVLAALASGGVGCGSRPTAPVALTATVDVAHPGSVLPADFLGLSFEASVLNSTLLDPAHSNLPTMLRNLGSGRLRFGGNSLDRRVAWLADPNAPLPSWAHVRVTPDDLGRLGALAASSGWLVDLGLALGRPDAVAAAGEAAAAARLIGPGLGTVEIGNEPDLLGRDPVLKPAGYSYPEYRADVNAYRAAIEAAVPGIGLAGPDTARLDWLAGYLHDEHVGLSFVTAHFYPLTRCSGSHPTIADLESNATARREQRMADAAAGAANREGLPVRVDETNSASCGGQDGVSNTLASALWMVDYLLLLAEHGVAGVNVHGGLAACRGYTALCVPGATGAIGGSGPGIDAVADASLGAGPGEGGRLVAQPDFYGLLLVRQLEGGRRLSVRLDRSSPIRVFAFGMPDGSIRVVFDNPDPRFAGRLLVRAAGHRGPATVLRLTGPSLGATSDVTLGGSPVAADGTWRAAPGPGAVAAQDGVRLDLRPASAAVVTLAASDASSDTA